MKKQINLDPNTTRALCKIAAQTNHTRKRLNAVVQREGSGLFVRLPACVRRLRGLVSGVMMSLLRSHIDARSIAGDPFEIYSR